MSFIGLSKFEKLRVYFSSPYFRRFNLCFAETCKNNDESLKKKKSEVMKFVS